MVKPRDNAMILIDGEHVGAYVLEVKDSTALIRTFSINGLSEYNNLELEVNLDDIIEI
jgi:hypothetical protein